MTINSAEDDLTKTRKIEHKGDAEAAQGELKSFNTQTARRHAETLSSLSKPQARTPLLQFLRSKCLGGLRNPLNG